MQDSKSPLAASASLSPWLSPSNLQTIAMRTSLVSLIALRSLTASVLANPLVTRNAVCSGLSTVAKCCSLDAVGVADLDCIARMFLSHSFVLRIELIMRFFSAEYTKGQG
jgi:hypothetical protein